VKKKERNLKKKEKAKRTKTLLVDFLSLLVTVNFTTNIEERGGNTTSDPPGLGLL
jgi:hypothetical protein